MVMKPETQRVVEAVCKYFDLPLKDFHSKKRYREIINAKQYVVYILRMADQYWLNRSCRYTWKEIAKVCGWGKVVGEHSTAIHHWEKMDGYVMVYSQYKHDLLNIGNELGLTFEGINLKAA